MDIFELKDENPILFTTDIIKNYENFILLIKSKNGNSININSFIITNNRLKFLSSSSPSFSVFLDSDKTKIIEELFKINSFETIVFEDFEDKFTFLKLLNFSKEYDRKYNGSSKNFYIKHKDLFIQNC